MDVIERLEVVRLAAQLLSAAASSKNLNFEPDWRKEAGQMADQFIELVDVLADLHRKGRLIIVHSPKRNSRVNGKPTSAKKKGQS